MVNCGIIGYGYMGEIRKNVIEKNTQAKLVAIADSAKSKPKDINKEYLWTNSYKDIISHHEIDAIFVCVPNYLIPEIAIEALSKGKHVFCEKPPGRTVSDICKMRTAEENNSSCKLMFGFNHRFHPAIIEAKEIVEKGTLGEILWIRGTYGKSGGENYEKSWRNNKEISGGGILLDQGIHLLDLLRYFCGDFQQVKALRSTSYWNIAVEDNAFVIMGNNKGQHALLHSSATLWKHTFNLEIGLEDGYLIVKGLLSKTGSYGKETLIVGYRQFEDRTRAIGNPREEKYYYDSDLSWKIELDNFIECIKNNKPVTICSSFDALRAMELVFEAYNDSEN